RRAEQYMVVERRQGFRVWKWLLETTATPLPQPGGRIELGSSGIRVRPVQIYDADGRDVTPKGARWQLKRTAGGWLLSLPLDDSRLPLPYVIDPASEYTAPIFLARSSTLGAKLWPMQTESAFAAPTPDTTSETVVDRLVSLGSAGGIVNDGFERASFSPTGASDTPASTAYTFSTGSGAGGSGDWGISTGKATTSVPSGGSIRIAYFPSGTITAADVDATVTVKPNPALDGAQRMTILLRLSGSPSSIASYRFEAFFSTDASSGTTSDDVGTYRVDIRRNTTLLGAATPTLGTYDGTSEFKLHVQIVGSELRANLWPASQPEPAGWTVTRTDTGIASAGGIGLRAENLATGGADGGTASLTWDDFTARSATAVASSDSGTRTGYWQFLPGRIQTFRDSDSDTPPSSSPNGHGFVFDAAAATGFEAGTWTFAVTTDIIGATAVSGSAKLAIGVWKVVLDGSGGIASSTLVLAPTDDPGGTNILSATTPVTTSVSLSLPAFNLAPDPVAGAPDTGEHLYVQLWRKQETPITGSSATSDLSVALQVNSATATRITARPAADDAGPTIDGGQPTLVPVTGGAFKSGGTIFYRGGTGNSGSFQLSATATDTAGTGTTTGVKGVNYPALTGGAAGWTHTAQQITSGPPFVSTNSYGWSGGTTSSPTLSVSAEDNALNTGAAVSFTLTNDNADPTGGALTVNALAASGGGSTSFDTDGAFPIDSRSDWTDADSGLVSSTLTRESATYSSPNTCGAFGGSTDLGAGTPAQSGLATGCYRFTLTGTDNVGNTVSVSTTVKVDLSDPDVFTPSISESDPQSHASGGTLFIRTDGDSDGGDFTISAAPVDADSGIQKVLFPSLAGITGGGNEDTTSTYDSTTYTWDTGDSDTAGNVTATNNAGRTRDAAVTVTVDNADPTGGALTVNGLAASGGGSTSYDTDGAFPIDSRSDWTDAGSGLVSSTLTRESAAYSSPNTCGAFGGSTDLGAGTPAQSGLTTGCYRFTLTGTDNVGNTVAVSTTVKVDLSDPDVFTPSISESDPQSHASGGTLFIRTDGD
ncbi:MAG: hypothetical protein HY511_08245, partial [Actinobacteria bacterium]|nr:hypothetical protein [Actinomycetota bacterium]